MNKVATRPVDALKNLLDSEIVKGQLQNALSNNAPLFTASIIDLFATDNNLQQCAPGAIVAEALKAAFLKLPIAKTLGFAYIIPYKGRPSFQLGYKGLVQLAKRSGIYIKLNASWIYKGEIIEVDRLTGDIISITGEPDGSGEIIGYFAYFKETNGFEKSLFRTKDEAEAHAQKYSASYRAKKKIWKDNPHEMHRKGVLKALLSQWGTLSIEIATAIDYDISGDSAIECDWSDITDQHTIESSIGKEEVGTSLADLVQGKVEKPETKEAETVEGVSCPNVNGDLVPAIKCGNCPSRPGCPSWTDEAGSDQQQERMGDPPPHFG